MSYCVCTSAVELANNCPIHGLTLSSCSNCRAKDLEISALKETLSKTPGQLACDLVRVEEERDGLKDAERVHITITNQLLAERDALKTDVEILNEHCDSLDDQLGAALIERDKACQLVADMHAAAVGCVRGPKIGVVEDVAALRTALGSARDALNVIKGEYILTRKLSGRTHRLAETALTSIETVLGIEKDIPPTGS